MTLKRPRSGIYVNETTKKKRMDAEIPFPTYNPRELQAELENIPVKNYDICETDDNQLFVKTPMAGADDNFNRETCCCYLFKSPVLDENDIRDDCVHYKPRIFEIPPDLELTFRPDVVFGCSAITEDKNNTHYDERKPMAVAAIYAAYATLFISYPGSWTQATIDEIITTGTELHKKSTDTDYKNSLEDFDIIPEILEKNTTIAITKLYTQRVNETQPNLLKVLSKYLEYYSHIMFKIDDMFLLIFKICESVFGIFDPRGRDNELVRLESGNATLTIVNTVEHVYHFIMNRNNEPFDENEIYHIYELKLINFGLITTPLEVGELRNNKMKYFNIINKFYSIIPGKIGIEPPKDKRDLNASIMVAYIAIVYSHIDPPRHWPRQIIDNLIKFGAKYYANFLTFHELDDMNIKDLPNVLVLGTYRALIHKQPFNKNGHIRNCSIFNNSTLGKAIRDFFTCENYGILQIDNSNLAIWRDDEFFYVFDPFQRGVVGQVIDESDGAGCLQMHITLTSLCKMVYNNALKMITEGNFFIHAMQIESINVLSANKYLKGADKNPVKLQIFYPINCDNVGQVDCDNLPIDPNSLPNVVPAECLSSISVKPCMRVCSETEFIESLNKRLKEETDKHELLKAYSLKSLQETEKFPEYGGEDIAAFTAKEIICDVMQRIEKKEDKEKNEFMKARKVLLKSDVGYLEELKSKIKRGEDYFSYTGEMEPPAQITLDDELRISSNFTSLPDGTWAIWGSSELQANDSDFTIAAISALLATVTSLKYKISSWSSNIIDFILDSSQILQNEFEPLNDMVKVLLKRRIPKITLGSQTFQVSIQKLYSGPASKLKHILAICLASSNKLLVMFSTFSCSVFKRNNFYYLFVGLPTDIVGFRSAKTGNACLLRFVDYSELIRRINFNRLQFNHLQKFVILNVHVRDITKKERDKYLVRTPSQEEDFYLKEVAEKLCRDKRLEAKLNYINDQIIQEKERIKLFLMQKNLRKIKKGEYDEFPDAVATNDFQRDDGEEGEEEDAEEEEDEDEKEEHKYKQDPEFVHFTPDDGPFYMKSERSKKPIEMGYRLRSDDCLYKIQGTTALEDRLTADTDNIKTCYIASVYAVLSAILRPLSRWDYRRCDTIIENATELMNKIKDKRTACERRINKIEIDDYIFSVNVKAFLTPSNKESPIETIINKLVIKNKKKYFLLQISNTTFAVYKDQYYHLFDPYPSMALNEAAGEEEEEENENATNTKKKVFPKGIKKSKEQNAASWILFANLKNMFSYIDDRAANPDWQYEFKLHIIDIISLKKGARKTRLAQFLVDLVDDDELPDDDNITCIKPERIKWLDIYPEMVPWSRLTRSNILKQERGTPSTREYAFDIEIPNELYSLWGSIHPLSAVFSNETRGKQYLAINVIACCTASLYRVTEWNREIVDTIVINGDKYLYESIFSIKRKDYELAIEDLNHNFNMQHVRFDIHIMHITYGLIYNNKEDEFNLSRALTYFLLKYRYGVILCMHRSLAFGKANKGYFLFDCQSFDQPLFPKDEGAAYLLRCNTLQRLLHCMILTLKIPYFNVDFSLFRVEVKVSLNPMYSNDDEDEGEEEEDLEE